VDELLGPTYLGWHHGLQLKRGLFPKKKLKRGLEDGGAEGGRIKMLARNCDIGFGSTASAFYFNNMHV